MYGILQHHDFPETRIIIMPDPFSYSVDKEQVFAGRAYTYTYKNNITLESYAYDSGYVLVKQGSVFELLDWLKTLLGHPFTQIRQSQIEQLKKDLSLLV